jgi:hypothetical protein
MHLEGKLIRKEHNVAVFTCELAHQPHEHTYLKRLSVSQ